MSFLNKVRNVKRVRVVADDSAAKMKALMEHLSIEDADDIEVSKHDANVFEALGGHEYMVLTDDEADEKAKQYIRDSLWAFNSTFITNYMDVEIPSKYIKKMQEDMSESCNEIMYGLVKNNYDKLVTDAIASDGRAHFMSTYDDKEEEVGGFFIYRMN